MKKQAGILLAFAAAITLAGCSRYTDEEAKALKDKQRTAEVAQFKDNGFEIVGTLREYSYPSATANNCYTLRKIPDNGVTYQGCIQHNRDGRKPSIYGLEALEKGLGR